MTIQEITNRLEVILLLAGVSSASLTDKAHFRRNLGLDSLETTDLLIQVEHEFGIHIPDENWATIQTVGQLKVYLAEELTSEAYVSIAKELLFQDDVYA